MKLKRKVLTIISTIVFIFANANANANAIEINSMFVTADEEGRGSFTITNSQDSRVFMNVAMFEISIIDNKIIKEEYNRNNIDRWKIDVRPAKTIIEPGYSKDFKVSMRCQNQCDLDKDELFQIAFVPSPYFSGESKPKQAVQMAVGFGALFMSASKDKPLDYHANYSEDGVVIRNDGGSYLKATLTSCSDERVLEEKKKCTRIFNVMSGRVFVFELPESMNTESLELTVETNNGKYSDKTILTK